MNNESPIGFGDAPGCGSDARLYPVPQGRLLFKLRQYLTDRETITCASSNYQGFPVVSAWLHDVSFVLVESGQKKCLRCLHYLELIRT